VGYLKMFLGKDCMIFGKRQTYKVDRFAILDG